MSIRFIGFHPPFLISDLFCREVYRLLLCQPRTFTFVVLVGENPIEGCVFFTPEGMDLLSYLGHQISFHEADPRLQVLDGF